MNQSTRGARKLISLYPELIEEWDYEKNKNICAVDNVSVGCNQKVWWICKHCGYSWQTQIYVRTSGHGCPECSKERVGKKISYSKTHGGERSLSTSAPWLKEEWLYEKNEGLSPDTIPVSSNYKVWWKCKNCGNEWVASVNNRSKGSRCPKCMSFYHTSYAEQAVFYYIKKLFPDAVNGYSPSWLSNNMEIDIFIPTLRIGIEYDGEAYHGGDRLVKDVAKAEIIKAHNIQLVRIREPKLSPINDGSYTITTEPPQADLKYLASAIRMLIEFINNEYGMHNETEIDLGKDYDDIVQSVHGEVKQKSFGSLFPEKAKLWNYDANGGRKPTEFKPSSNVKVWWKCTDCGYEWQATIGSIKNGHGCPACARKVPFAGKNDLATLYPMLIEEWSPNNESNSPDQYLPNSSKRVWWRCKECGNEWIASINSRTANKSGCPKCSKKRSTQTFTSNRIKRDGSFGDNYPNLLLEWDYSKNKSICDPREILSGSHNKVWWKCHVCGFEWMAAVYSRTAGRGCPNCKANKMRKVNRRKE